MSKSKPLTNEEITRALFLNRQRRIGREIDEELERLGYTWETVPKTLLARIFAHQLKTYQAKRDLLIAEREHHRIQRAAGKKPPKREEGARSPFPNRGPHRKPRH